MEENKVPRFYSPQDVADILHITIRTVYSYMKQGKLHAIKIGQYWHISQENLDLFLQGEKQI